MKANAALPWSEGGEGPSNKWQRRTVYYLLLLAAVMLVYAVLYHHWMRIYEGDSLSFWHSLQVVVETFTTTGYGSDAPWESPEMNAFVIVMDLTGVLLIFMALPVLVFPLLEDVLSTTAPTAVDEDLDDHVVICTHSPRSDTLIAELGSWGVEYVIVEPDRERATGLYETGYDVVHADPETIDGLSRANVSDARALVADISDRVDASIVLTAKELAEDVPVVSVVDEPDRATYHRLAGADEVLSPRPLLGRSLASKVTTAVTTDADGAVEIGDDFEIAEVPIHRNSPLVGQTLAESEIRDRTGANVVGAWIGGGFESPPTPDTTLDGGTVLLVTGTETAIEALKELTLSEGRRFGRGETIVVGYGEVGRTVADALGEAGVSHTIVDVEPLEDVDVVGDATDPETLRAAGVENARSVVLALPDDTTTEFATLVIRDVSPETEIVARAEGTESVRKIHRAGADYVLSLAAVSGRMLASTVLEGEDVLSFDTRVEVIKTEAPGLVGLTLGEARVRSRTGCTVVGVERDGAVIADVGPAFRVRDGDELVIAGTDEGTNRFTQLLS